MAILYETSGTSREVHPANGKAFSLAELQAFVLGHIELVRLADGRIMFVNEEGKLSAMSLNRTATLLTRDVLPNDIIVGPVIVGTPQEMGENEEDGDE